MSLMVLLALAIVAVGAGLVVGSMASRRLGPSRDAESGGSSKSSPRTARDWATRAAVRAWKWRNKKSEKRREP